MADGEEVRFLVVNDAAVGRDAHLAVRKCIKSIDCLIGRGARCQVDQNLDVGCRIVVYLAYFYLSFIDSFQDGVDDRSRGSAIRDFGDTSVLLSTLLILDRILTAPPRSPSLYFDTSIEPPVWKSGYSLNSSLRR